ncbi:hypothetical protein ACC691_39830, partial [Rhizobium johnstonii]|uniref:hypothetical protein n=1 Tax=Rhizobium johnstonii TaxID=3019933 RepID=UPI003F9A2DDC
MIVGASAPTLAAPGSPGVMGAPRLVFYEGFENDVPAATPDFVQTISDYDDGVNAPVAGYRGVLGEAYASDPAWN